MQLHHPRRQWDLGHLLQFQWDSRVVLVTRQGLELRGGLFKVRQMRRAADGSLQEGDEVVL